MNTNFRLLSVYTMSLLAFMLRKSAGEHQIPQFIDKWYGAGYYEGKDACGVDAFNYINVQPTPLEVFGSPSPSCYWKEDSFKHEYDDPSQLPSGFISQNLNDWNQILLDPTNPVSGWYSIEQICENDDSPTGFGAWIYPLYDCPEKTRVSFDNVTHERGCTTTPTPCLADVVGRDLAISNDDIFQPIVESAGHVGLVAAWGHANPNILEVLNGTDPAISGIFLDPLYGEKSFTTQSKYWGSRYQPQNFARLPLTLASQVIQAGIDQQQYLFKYTLSTFYYPGGTQKHPDNCQFRCDSFVYYCYDAGARIKLQPVLNPLFTVPWTIFNDFMLSADPVEHSPVCTGSSYYCCTIPDYYCHLNTKEINSTLLFDHTPNGYPADNLFNTRAAPHMTSAQKIFQRLRPILLTKETQREYLPALIEQYQSHKNVSMHELFVRCVCFELNKISPDKIDEKIRPLLSDILWQHKYLSSDNFLLAVMENALSFYLENPHCDWLSAFLTAKADTKMGKEVGMIAYVDQQDNVTEKANLVTASRFSLLSVLSDEKRHVYGSLFRKAYNSDQSLPESARKLILLSLSEMKTPLMETNSEVQFFQQSNITVNRGAKRNIHP